MGQETRRGRWSDPIYFHSQLPTGRHFSSYFHTAGLYRKVLVPIRVEALLSGDMSRVSWKNKLQQPPGTLDFMCLGTSRQEEESSSWGSIFPDHQEESGLLLHSEEGRNMYGTQVICMEPREQYVWNQSASRYSLTHLWLWMDKGGSHSLRNIGFLGSQTFQICNGDTWRTGEFRTYSL